MLRRRRRQFIQILLRLSLSASVLLMVLGMIVWVASGERESPSTTPSELLGVLDMGHRLMLTGILLLAITPALRVVALLGLWIRERAWRFAATAALVLVLLGIAFWAGGG
ncbi:MAG: DUF1634 domain-containing protein [Actinobacteria bacterium]|nr:DUF1634 domain-containing protein [Actinomycetota bacterium]